jgi:hypothetical protein
MLACSSVKGQSKTDSLKKIYPQLKSYRDSINKYQDISDYYFDIRGYNNDDSDFNKKWLLYKNKADSVQFIMYDIEKRHFIDSVKTGLETKYHIKLK